VALSPVVPSTVAPSTMAGTRSMPRAAVSCGSASMSWTRSSMVPATATIFRRSSSVGGGVRAGKLDAPGNLQTAGARLEEVDHDRRGQLGEALLEDREDVGGEGVRAS
jgi:hypothetical protein